MSPLHQLLIEIENSESPLTLLQLSRRLNTEPGAVQGMIDFWVRKGRLRVNGAETCDSRGCHSCSSGSGDSRCPALLVVPKKYEVINHVD